MTGVILQLNASAASAGQDPAIVSGAVRFMWLSAPALFCYTMCECMKRYLLAQAGASCITFTLNFASHACKSARL